MDSLVRSNTLASIPPPSHRDEKYRFLDPRDLVFSQNENAASAGKNINSDKSAPREAKGVVVQSATKRSAEDQGQIIEDFKKDYFLSELFERSSRRTVVTLTQDAIMGWDDLFPSGQLNDVTFVVEAGKKVALGIQLGPVSRSSDKEVKETAGDLSVIFIDIQVKNGAELEWLGIFSPEGKTDFCVRTRCSVAESGKAKIVWLQRGGRKFQTCLLSQAHGKDSDIQIRAAVFSKQKEIHDFQVDLLHQVPQTKSDLKTWMIVEDQARAGFNGKIKITSEAVGTEAYQQTRGLLLSQNAFIENQPKLEIETDEVKCAHGAAISPISEEHLFYMQSRGVTKSLAEKMIISGFAKPLLIGLHADLVERVKSDLFLKDRFFNESTEEFSHD